MPPSGEAQIIEWLKAHKQPRSTADRVMLGIGDDMAILRAGQPHILITTDMLLDGVHFDRAVHDLSAIGRKAIACCLSDCAAMAVQPFAAVVSVALPRSWRLEDTKALYAGMHEIAGAFHCPIVGGDTTSWDQRLAIDVCMLATPHAGITPVRRDGARPGDVLYVTGQLGGSILGRHMTFTPRVRESRLIAERFGDRLHAMMDISDGLALDLHRLCRASGVGVRLDERLLHQIISPDARRLSTQSGRTPLDHALSDGEDFELLLAAVVEPDQASISAIAAIETVNRGVIETQDAEFSLLPIGRIVPQGFFIFGESGERQLEPTGYEHLAG